MKSTVSVYDMANAREVRVEKVKGLLSSEKTAAVISFTLNIPGPVKDLPLYREIHKAGMAEIIKSLKWGRINYSLAGTSFLPTGAEGLLIIHDCAPDSIKRITVEIEDTHPLGRFFDIDIFKKPCEKVSSGRALRRCFICGNSAFACARNESHPYEILVKTIEQKSEEHFRSYYPWKIAETACRALLSEAAATPKPGLVDRQSAGAHSDMDFFSFINSSAALFRTFYVMAQTGYDFRKEELSGMFDSLKMRGIEGEKEMLTATGGVNTHKGLIFSLGLMSAAAGYLCARHGGGITADKICLSASRIISPHVSDYLSRLAENQKGKKLTRGEKTFLEHGIRGARGEAEGGFRTALYGYSILSSDIDKGKDFNLSLVDTLMHIMEKAQDTNITGRKDIEALSYINSEARRYNRETGVFSDSGLRAIRKLDMEFTEKNLSPGGCADILAMSVFLCFAEKDIALPG